MTRSGAPDEQLGHERSRDLWREKEDGGRAPEARPHCYASTVSGLIEIADSRPSLPRGEELAFDLIDLLRLVAPEGPTLAWATIDLWTQLREAAPLPNGRRYGEFEAAIRAAPAGVRVSWDELLALAEAFQQVIDGVFVACQAGAPIPSLDAGLTPQFYAACAIVLEALDSTLWRVYARDPAVLQRIRAAFHDITEVSIP